MRTFDYEYYKPPFARYNVAQAQVIPHVADDNNIIVSFATAVGKTVVAECAFGFHLTTGKGNMAYICPFKSLAEEKYGDWCSNDQLNTGGVSMWTGDTTERDISRIVLLTSEAFDSKTRSEVYSDWIDSLGCIVVDEAHLIGHEKRGAALETALMRVTEKNPSARLILLSATMDNAIEIAKWVKSLNNKPTKCVKSDWRPTEVVVEYITVNSYTEKLKEAVGLAAASQGKTVVFVHSKRIGRQIVKDLKKKGVRSCFHNASVSRANRLKMENLFNDELSGMDVLVSTSTLSAGVNIG